VELRGHPREPDAKGRGEVAAAYELAPRLEQAQDVGEDVDAIGITNGHASATVGAVAAFGVG
jgi:hypothetical protein